VQKQDDFDVRTPGAVLLHADMEPDANPDQTDFRNFGFVPAIRE
jgi:hypothetical protein